MCQAQWAFGWLAGWEVAQPDIVSGGFWIWKRASLRIYWNEGEQEIQCGWWYSYHPCASLNLQFKVSPFHARFE